MKTLQDHIEEEKEKFRKVRTDAISEMFDNVDEYGIYPTGKFFNSIDDFLSLSLQRIAKITAEEIVPDKRISYVKERDKISFDEFIIYNDGYLKCWLALQTKIKEFGI